MVYLDTLTKTDIVDEDGCIGGVKVFFPGRVWDGEIFDDRKKAKAVYKNVKEMDKNAKFTKIQVGNG